MVFCKYFGRCGGCTLQDILYEKQLKKKEDMVRHAAGRMDLPIHSLENRNYRNRMDFIFHKDGLGLRERMTRGIVDIDSCPIAENRINVLLSEVRNYFKRADVFIEESMEGAFKYATIRNASSGSTIIFLLNDDAAGIKDAIIKVKGFSEKTSAENIIISRVSKFHDTVYEGKIMIIKGDVQLTENLLGKKITYSAISFFQNNTKMADVLHTRVHEMVKQHRKDKTATLLDLYGGVGAFGIANADLFSDVVVVDIVEPAIIQAKENLSNNHIENANAFAMDSADLGKLVIGRPSLVITDPPRTGMDHRTISLLRRLAPETIIYISCNPSRMGRELLLFRGYDVLHAEAFDLFPQTEHVEAVIVLHKL